MGASRIINGILPSTLALYSNRALTAAADTVLIVKATISGQLCLLTRSFTRRYFPFQRRGYFTQRSLILYLFLQRSSKSKRSRMLLRSFPRALRRLAHTYSSFSFASAPSDSRMLPDAFPTGLPKSWACFFFSSLLPPAGGDWGENKDRASCRLDVRGAHNCLLLCR